MIDSRSRSWFASARRFLLPDGSTPDTGIILSARTLRGFGDGFVSVLLPVRLADLGFSGSAVGAIASATLFGSAVATLASGIYAGKIDVQMAWTWETTITVKKGGQDLGSVKTTLTAR